MPTPAPASPFRPADRAFFAGLAALLLAVAAYTALGLAAWSRTPLGENPQGDARAWLAVAESLHEGTAPREPFFRAPAYPTLLAGLRDLGVPAADLGATACAVNGFLHLLATALVAVVARRLWGSRGAAWLAGALWGFYPPMIFLAAEPGPETLAVLLWLAGVSAALGDWWMSPGEQGGRLSRRHLWAYPLAAGVAFASAAALWAPLWPAALAWPVVALLLASEGRGARVLTATAGMAGVAGGVMLLQAAWGGSPQPLAGADLYRLALGLEVTKPWTAPLPAIELRAAQRGPDELEDEARALYRVETGVYAPGRAVLAGYWRQRAAGAATTWPLKSLIRVARKSYQFLSSDNSGAGPSFARARGELAPLRWNPLGWPALLALGGVGLALGWRQSGVPLLAVLGVLASLGALLWHPTFAARAPAVAALALLAGGCAAGAWPRGWGARAGLTAFAAALLALAWWPRPDNIGAKLAARDARQRAVALAELGRMDEALAELARADEFAPGSMSNRELAAGWRFARLLQALPVVPPTADLEAQLLDNTGLSGQSPAAQFRSGACLWLLGRRDGALYYWRALAAVSDNDAWGAAARQAVARSGQETPTEAERRAAWEIGRSPRPPPSAAAFLSYLQTAVPAQ